MDTLKIIQKIPTCPPFFEEENLNKYGEKITTPLEPFPKQSFASARLDHNGRGIPQVIAHRGYKAKCPENSISAFQAAVEAGAHAVETDVHLSKDKVIVLSHDPDLKRCFGVDRRISDCDWSFLQSLRTTRSPNKPLACLGDLLAMFQKPQWVNIWLMVDIKMDDDPEELMYYLAEAFRTHRPGFNNRWEDKVLLGFWTAKLMSLCHKHLPGFPVTNVGFSPTYSRNFLTMPNTSFVMLYPTLVSPSGRKFIRTVKTQQRQIYAWTVNDEKGLDWCVKKGVDGIITDEVERFFAVCAASEEKASYRWSLALLVQFILVNFWVAVFDVIFPRRYGANIVQAGDKENK